MKVSIIIPVYNVERYVTQCLESINNMSINYEIIIVNDGSTDNSLKKVQEFVDSYKGEIKVITKENGGLSSARNTGIQKANGDYILFLDSDDYIDKNLFASFAEDVIRDNVDIGFANYKYLRNGKIEDNTEAEYRKYIKTNSNYFVDGLTFGSLYFDKVHNFINTEACFLLIKRSFLIENHIKFKQGVYHEDTLFTITCLTIARRVKYYDYPFYIYRMRDDSIIHTPNPRIIEKKFEDKGIIALEIFKLKEKHKISLPFIDSLIIDLLLVSAMHFKIKSSDYCRIISQCKKMTVKSRLRVILYSLLSISYK